MEEFYYPSADGKSEIHAVLWLPDGEVSGVLQIIHGMSEYAERYSRFAGYMNSRGIAVCAEDHLGHGKTAKRPEELGKFDDKRDYKTVLSDIRHLHAYAGGRFAGSPYFMLGHSMGSFLLRNYLAEYGKEISGAIIMGTGYMGAPVLNAALFLTRLNALFFGWENRSKFIKKLAFGSYNKKFKQEKNAFSWLSADKENVKAYNADGLCGFDFTDNGYKVLFSAIKSACSQKTVSAVPKSLPVLFVSGRDDPVGNYGKGVLKTFKKFKAAGVNNARCILYEGCRHEILNDVCRERVYGDILSFVLDKKI